MKGLLILSRAVMGDAAYDDEQMYACIHTCRHVCSNILNVSIYIPSDIPGNSLYVPQVYQKATYVPVAAARGYLSSSCNPDVNASFWASSC